MTEVRRHLVATKALAWSVTVTLRHFPSEAEISFQQRVPDLPGSLGPETKQRCKL